MPRQPSVTQPVTLGPGDVTTEDWEMRRVGTGNTEWPRAIVAPPGGGRWIAARARVIDDLVIVMDRTGTVVADYQLDRPPGLDPDYPSPRLIGLIDGDELSIDVDGGCMCETTRWLNQGEW